jgi:hypothetical protein
VSGFSDTWLRLREPVDAASRDRGLVAGLSHHLAQPIHAIDLATGTAANLRYLSPLLGGAQTWQLIDHDQALLDAIPARLAEWSRDRGSTSRASGEGIRIDDPGFECEVHYRSRDLARDLTAINVPRGSLVTAAALLDLVSDSWLADLAAHCRASYAPVLFALTYNGEIRFEPSDPEDELVTALVNRHQSTDKGFGQLQRALLEGWTTAAIEMAPAQAGVLGHWAERRNQQLASGRSTFVVGHTDLVGLPPRDSQGRA